MPTKSPCRDSRDSCKLPPFNLKSSCELHTQVTNWTTPPLPLPMLHCHHTAYFSPTFFTLLPIPLLLITNSRQLQQQIKLLMINVWPPLCSASTSSNTTLSLFIFTSASTFFPVLVFTTVNQASKILPYHIIHQSSRPILWHCSFITDTKRSKPHPLLPAQYWPTHHVHRLSFPATTSKCSSMLVHEQFPSGAHEEIPICAMSVIAMSHSSY